MYNAKYLLASIVALLDFLELLMHSIVPLTVAVLISAALLIIGVVYVLAPERILGSFGLQPPALDRDTLAWLRLKGIRDIASGLTVLILLVTTDHRTVGTVLLTLAIIPFGDMSNIALSGGRKITAFSVHGLTCAAMVCAGLLLLYVL